MLLFVVTLHPVQLTVHDQFLVEAKAVAAILGPDGTPYARSPYLFEFTFPKLLASFGGIFLTSLDVGRRGAQGATVCFAQEHLSNEASPCETAHWRIFSASM